MELSYWWAVILGIEPKITNTMIFILRELTNVVILTLIFLLQPGATLWSRILKAEPCNFVLFILFVLFLLFRSESEFTVSLMGRVFSECFQIMGYLRLFSCTLRLLFSYQQEIKQYLNVKNTVKLKALHFNVSSDLKWLGRHSSPDIFHQSILYFRCQCRNNFCNL